MNMNERKLVPIFPDINDFLCGSETISLQEANMNYRDALIKTNLQYNIEYANKLAEYQNINRPNNFVPIKRDLEQFISHMKKWKKKKGYKFQIVFKKRKKNYKKFNEKVRLFIESSLNAEDEYHKSKFSLERICDEIGIRLILLLGNVDTIETVKICYEVLFEVNRFFTVEKGYLPMTAEPLYDLGFNSKNYPNVIVPTDKDIVISDDLRSKVKDYYKTPKAHSYQSLHIAYSSSLYGLPFEVQIRTMATHTRVEYETSLHDEHDKKRYYNRIELDRPNINIYGYRFVKTVDDNGLDSYVVEDLVGLEKSVNPFEIIY